MMGQLPPRREDIERTQRELEAKQAELAEAEGRLEVVNAELAEHEGFIEVQQWVSASTGKTMSEADALADPEHSYPRTVRYRPYGVKGAKGRFVKKSADTEE